MSTSRHSWIRLVCALALPAGLCHGQIASGAAALTTPEQAVQKTTAAWRVLARDLDTRVARMLPCDPRARQSIEETSRSSQARLTALADYYQTVSAIATTRTEGAKRLLGIEQKRAATLSEDLAESQEVLAAVQQQAADLEGSSQDQAALGGALAALRQAVESTRQRSNTIKDQETRIKAALAALARLVQVYEAREVALGEAIKAFDAERTRWNAYYAARLARAELECQVTNPDPAPKPPAPKPPAPKPAKVKAKAATGKANASSNKQSQEPAQ